MATKGDEEMTAQKLIQITDFHINADPSERAEGRDTLKTLGAVVEAVRPEVPDLVLATGDLVNHGSPAAYGRLRPLLHRLGRPVAAIPGNHDLVAAMQEHLADDVISLERVRLAGGWSIVLLDSTVEGEHHGHLGPDRLALLDRQLGEAAGDHVLIVMHRQPAPIGSPFDDVGLDNAEGLYAVMDRHAHICGLLWGHIHHVHESERNGVRLMGTPSTCVQFKHGPHDGFGYTDEPPAYRRLALHDDGRIETAVVWCRRRWITESRVDAAIDQNPPNLRHGPT